MAKDFTEVAFNPVQFKKELDGFRDLLKSKNIIDEREIQKLFKASLHLTAYIGTAVGNIGIAKQVAFEFEILGDYAADIVFGHHERQFLFCRTGKRRSRFCPRSSWKEIDERVVQTV